MNKTMFLYAHKKYSGNAYSYMSIYIMILVSEYRFIES